MSKFIFTQSANYSANINGVMTPIKSFAKGDIITGNPFYNNDGTLNSVSYFVTGLPSSIPNINKWIRISASYIKPYVNVRNISNKYTEISSSVDGGIKLEKYKFTRDFSAYPSLPEGMTGIAAVKTAPTIFKKGEVVEGNIVAQFLGGVKGSSTVTTKASSLKFSKNGWENYEIALGGSSPLEKVLTADLSQRQVDSVKSSSKEKSDSYFTTKNIVISVAVLGIIYFGLKYIKVI
jgi:hypothetical protein